MGDVRRLQVTFTDPLADDVNIDPTVVSLTVKQGDNDAETFIYSIGEVIEKLEVGVYVADISLTTPGIVAYRWFSTGAGQASEGGTFLVHKNVV